MIAILVIDTTLPYYPYRLHILKNNWNGVWECHIMPDWLLLYQVTETELILIRTGTHQDLFS